MSQPSVLICTANPQVAFLIASDLARRGVRVEAVGDAALALCRWSRHIERFHVAPSLSNTQAYVDFICAVSKTRGIDLYLPSFRGVFLLAPFRERLWRETRYPFPDAGVLDQVNDKSTLAATASRAGLNTPPAVMLPPDASVRYPVVGKPRDGFGGRGFVLLNNRTELESHARNLRKPEGWLFQEYIPGPLMVWIGIRWKGKLRAAFTFETLRTTPAFGGSSVLRRSVIDPRLDEASMRLLDCIGYEGMCTLDYIRDERDGKPYLIDFNPRFGTSLHAPLAAGVSFPHCLLKLALGEEFDPPAYEPGIVSSSLLGHVGRIVRGGPRRPPLPLMLAEAAQAFLRPDRAEEFYSRSPVLIALNHLLALRRPAHAPADRKEGEDGCEWKTALDAHR